MNPARATAHANIALVKYWGKRDGVDPDLNLPAVGSLSMTLDDLRTETRVSPASADTFDLDGENAPDRAAARVFQHLDRIWTESTRPGRRPPCRVESTNHLPTAAGLASSASGFAALTLAAATAFGLDLDRAGLSALARRGSGSAARSLWGGFVRLDRGEADDGSDCSARQLHRPEHWDLRLIVAQAATGPKSVGSTEGMILCRETSPYYPAWVASSPQDLDAAGQALHDCDLERLGQIVEHSCFKMHACMLASNPPLVYWNPITLALVDAVHRARAEGLAGYITSDAGPHIKVLCREASAEAIVERLVRVHGTHQITVLRPGPDPTVERLV